MLPHRWHAAPKQNKAVTLGLLLIFRNNDGVIAIGKSEWCGIFAAKGCFTVSSQTTAGLCFSVF